MMNPKAFISYSWTTPDHEAWVLRLATELREVGVDVVLDKWDLKEGHDAIAFMEQMVTNPEVKKVILVCDQKYAEKTDGRVGGVGTEAQIISPAVYAKSDQNKFVAVVTGFNADGKPFLPTYYRGRIYINLSGGDVYAQNFEQLVRWIYDKPVHAKPAVGRAPSYLSEDVTPKLANAALHYRALDAIKTDKPFVRAALEEYLESCISGMEAFRISGGDSDFDDRVVASVEDFLPHRAQLIEIFVTLARYPVGEEVQRQVQRFFERLLPFMEPPEGTNQYREWDFDNYRFIVHELFLYLESALLKYEAFEFAARMMREPYFISKGRRGRESNTTSFTAFRNFMRSLEHRSKRLSRLSVRADLLEVRSHSSGVGFESLMQADFVLFLRSCLDALRGTEEQWWPETLLYCDRYRGAFEIFARSRSTKYFTKVALLFDIKSKAEIEAIFKAFEEKKLYSPTWQFEGINSRRLLGFDTIATAP